MSVSDLLARYSHLEALIHKKRVLEVGGHFESEGESTLKLWEMGAHSVSIWAESTAYEIDGTECIQALDGLWLDVALVHDIEALRDQEWLAQLARVIGSRGTFVLLCEVDAWPYEDIIAALEPHFPTIELQVETRLATRVFTPVGVEDPDVAVDGSLAGEQTPVFYLFVCGAQPAGLAAQTVALVEAVQEEVRDVAEIEDLTSRLRDAAYRLAEKTEAADLASEALANAELRLEELQRTLRDMEPERDRANEMQRHAEEQEAREQDLQKAILELESARRLEQDERVRSERLAAELDVRLKLQKGELAQREQRVKRLVEEVQRLEGELEKSREEAEEQHASLVQERDSRRETAQRLQRDNDSLRTESARLQALLTRARDDLQGFGEQQHNARQLVEMQAQRSKEAADALVAASALLTTRERELEDARAQLSRSDEQLVLARHDAETFEASLVEWTHKHAVMRAAKDSVEAALKGATRSLQETRDALLEREERIPVLERHIADYRALITTAEAEARDLRGEKDRIESEAIAKRRQVDAALGLRETLERDLAESRAKLEGLRGHIDGVRQESSARERELESLQAEIMRRVDECESLKAEGSMLRSTLQEAEERCTALESKEADLAEQKKIAEARRDEAQIAAKLVETERDRLRTELAQAELRATTAETERRVNAEVASQNDRGRRESEQALTAERERAQRLELDRDRLATERDRISSERDRAVVERDRLTVERDRLSTDSTRFAAAEQQRSDLDKELAATKGKLDAMEANLVAERSTKSVSERDLVSARTRIEVLSKDIESERTHAAQLARLLELERALVGELKRDLQKAATSSTTAPPASSALDKSQEWQMLDSFHEDLPDQTEEHLVEEKTRVLK